MKPMKTESRELLHLVVASVVTALYSVFWTLINFIDRIYGFFHGLISSPSVQRLLGVPLLGLALLLWVTYRLWKKSTRRKVELKTIIESIRPDVLLVVDPDRTITMCTGFIKEMFGYGADDVVNKKTEFLYSDRRSDPRIHHEIYNILEEQSFHVGEASGRKRNGDHIHLEIISGNLKDYSGAVLLLRDITKRKRAEEELREAQENAMRQERLRVVGQMASGIAHDINNVLQPILGYSQLLLRKPGNLADKTKSRLQEISIAAKDAARVVNRLYEFSNIREKQEPFGPVDINRVVEQSISLTEPKWRSQAQAQGCTIGIEKELQALSPFLGHEMDLREVITNLIFNAVDAMPDGGTITLRTRTDENHVVIEVSDTGTGMNEEVRRHCLDPFFSTKGNHGAGLGLWMVSWIIRRHKGTIELENAEGGGTTMIVRLPKGKDVREEPRKEETGYLPSRALRILFVEDDIRVCKLVSEFLNSEGHIVETASDGREGLERFDPQKFDLVIADQAMPGLTGGQMAVAIKEKSPEKPIILLTGFGELSNAPGAKPEGADLVINKPVGYEELRQAIAKMGQGA